MLQKVRRPRGRCFIRIANAPDPKGHKKVDEPIETVNAKPNPGQKYQAWQLKSINDSDRSRLALRDRLTIVRNGKEIEVSFCGIKAPDEKQELEIKARNYMRSRGARHCVIAY